MIGEYTYSELTDTRIMFARAYRSTLHAQRLYLEAFPGRWAADRKTFSSIHQRLSYSYAEITSQNT
jgi:hypothetical protein